MQVGSHSGSRAGRWRAPVLFAGVVAVLVGLAVVVPGVVRAGSREPNPPVAASASPQPTGPQWWTVSAVVLDSGGGPQLCVGAVAESYPPQCGGPRIIGWDWDAVTGDEAASGVRWGEYEVVGTYVGGSSQDEQGVFTLTLPAGPARPPTDVPPPDPFGTPCPEPDGGWIVDRSKTDDIALHRAAEEAERLPGLGELWVDTTGSSTGTILNIFGRRRPGRGAGSPATAVGRWAMCQRCRAHPSRTQRDHHADHGRHAQRSRGWTRQGPRRGERRARRGRPPPARLRRAVRRRCRSREFSPAALSGGLGHPGVLRHTS